MRGRVTQGIANATPFYGARTVQPGILARFVERFETRVVKKVRNPLISTYRATQSAKNATFCSDLSQRPPSRGLDFWYVAFIVQSAIQALLIIRDWSRDCLKLDLRVTFQLFFTGWIEVITTTITIFLLWYKTKALWTSLTILLALLILRELIQMAASLKRYLLSPENWLEMVMIGIAGGILWSGDRENCSMGRNAAAVAIVLSWAELITLVARHPNLQRYNVYVTMFYKVLKTFFLFLVWYSFFVVAFGFGFYIMLHKDTGIENGDEDEYVYFNEPFLALVKTSTMFVGELEFSDVPIATANVIGFGFLLSFVFLIVVVLMNLLNGLAVSDTGLIRARAEVVGAVSRVETVSYVESLLLGDPFDFLGGWPRAVSWLRSLPALALCRSLFRSRVIRDASVKVTGAANVLLFYEFIPDKTLTIYPNKKSGFCLINLEVMSEKVIAKAKTIITNKQKATLDDGLQCRIKAIEEKLDQLLFLHAK